jgi:hypothetical protein
MIDQIAKQIDPRLANTSGKVFYSGRAAFASPRCVYVVGINPGGDPEEQANETVGSHTRFVLSEAPEDWSAYVDEDWQGKAMQYQRGMQHLFEVLSLNPHRVASSNLIFTRSRVSADLGLAERDLIETCWPVHAAVLDLLKPRAIICLGELPAKEFRRRIGGLQQVATFVERNNRRWPSTAWRSPAGGIFFQLTHPSRADWTNPDADPSNMVKSILAAC